MHARPRVAVSACLLGAPVRFDGGHRRNSFVTALGAHADLVSVCPELEAGLGAPRPSLRLVNVPSSPGKRLRVISSRGADETDRLSEASSRCRGALGEIDGAILKKASPTCGPTRVKVYGTNGMPLEPGRGVFAEALSRSAPWVPVEDEGRLEDDSLRDSFLARVFVLARLRGLLASRWSLGDLVAFHARHKLMVLAHDQRGYRRLGHLVAAGAGLDRSELATVYRDGLMAALAVPARTGQHANVMQHMSGYLTDRLDSASRRELQAVIEDFARGLQPIAAPRTLLRHHVRHSRVSYLEQQVYFQPYPSALVYAGR